MQTTIAAPKVHTNDTTITTVAPTCPSCDGHNVSDPTGLGSCGDCGLTDSMSAFMGGKMTAKAAFKPSRFARPTPGSLPRAFTIRGNID